ncbi:G-protein coupled receptor moody-like [Saccoglossus kowalevskii]|uniref:G-protein coupled receptor moody-like n=1 Tax=Saccoglossus kowalevskii TaxID=10224 RepID=A0ABM0MMK3_SACKO|nr:PREDICTED: G-protein coupled receptor moody-like [Saccoglossus kowalevskii]
MPDVPHTDINNTQGNVTTFQLPHPDSSYSLAWLEIPLLWIITGVSMTTNCMVLIILLKKPKLRTVTNLLVLNLTVSDLLLCVISVPFITIAIAADDWILGTRLCHFTGFLISSCICGMLWTLLFISVNRYYMIVHAQTYAVRFSKRRAKKAIYFLWTVAIATAVLPLLGWGEYTYDTGRNLCFIGPDTSPSNTIFFVTVSTIVPFLLMVYCYWNIFLAVRQNSRRIKNTAKALIQTSALVIAEGAGSPHMSNMRESRAGKRMSELLPRLSDSSFNPRLALPRVSDTRRLSSTSMASITSRVTLIGSQTAERPEQGKLTRMLVLVFSVYAVLWMPVALSMFVEASYNTRFNKHLEKLLLFMLYLLTGVNPLVYGLINETYRKVFCSVLCCQRSHFSHMSRRRHVTMADDGNRSSIAMISAEQGYGNRPNVSVMSYADRDSLSKANTYSLSDTKCGSYVEVQPAYLELSSSGSPRVSVTNKPSSATSPRLTFAWQQPDYDYDRRNIIPPVSPDCCKGQESLTPV